MLPMQECFLGCTRKWVSATEKQCSGMEAYCDQCPSHTVCLDIVIQTFGDLDEALDGQVLEFALLLSIAGHELQKLQ